MFFDYLDTIDQHIVETETHVDTSNVQLKQAVIYQVISLLFLKTLFHLFTF
jgi:hypothetical protein